MYVRECSVRDNMEKSLIYVRRKYNMTEKSMAATGSIECSD